MIIYTYSISVYLCNIQTILICMKYYLYTKNLSCTVYLFNMGFMGIYKHISPYIQGCMYVIIIYFLIFNINGGITLDMGRICHYISASVLWLTLNI